MMLVAGEHSGRSKAVNHKLQEHVVKEITSKSQHMKTMAAPMSALHLMCLLLWTEVYFAQFSVLEHQQGVIEAAVGDNVTLNCSGHDDVRHYYWYKHTVGYKPELLSSRSKNAREPTWSEKYKNNPRLSLVLGEGINHLKISDVRLSDSAVYYCVTREHSDFQFSEAITLRVNLTVEGPSFSIQATIQQPIETKPGDSVTLNCTVYTAGGYHCAVTSCGETMDADRGKVFLGVALSICIILIIVLSSIICKLKGQSSTPPTNTGKEQNEDSLHYASVRLDNRGRPRPLRDNVETVYNGVR